MKRRKLRQKVSSDLYPELKATALISTSFPSFDGFREAEEHQYSDILFDGLVLECGEIVAQFLYRFSIAAAQTRAAMNCIISKIVYA